MPKPNPLSEGLNAQPVSARRGRIQKPLEVPVRPASRSGRVLVGGHFAPEVQTALKVIAAEERTTVQALLTEGINAIFARRRKPEIAAASAE